MSDFSGVSRGLTRDIQQDLEERNNASGGGFGWFKLKRHGDSARARFLFATEEDPNLIAVYEHSLSTKEHKRNTPPFDVTCIGRNNGCPFCEAGRRNSLKAYLVFWNYDAEPDSEGKVQNVQVWKRGTRDINNVLGLIAEYGALNERDFKITRQGNTKENTTYQFFARDKAEFEHAAEAEEALPGVIEGVLKVVKERPIDDLVTLMNGGDVKREDDETTPVKPPDGYKAGSDEIPF